MGAIGTTGTVAAEDGSRVTGVAVEGLKTIAEETCLARIETRAGMAYSDSVTSEDIRRLYALGYFTDVRVDTEPHEDGVKVIFRVKEKPAIQDIQLEGELKMPKSKILSLLGLKKGDLYDPRKLKEGLDQIRAEYRRKGFYRAEIATSTEDHTDNTTTLFIVIDSGPRMRVKDILVEGNLAFPDKKIRKLVKTKQRNLWRPGTFDEQVLEEDLERIRSFYKQHGYQDVQVDHEVTTDPSGQWLFVHFRVTEGQQHRVGDVTVTGNQLFPEREIKQQLTLKPGAVFNQDALQGDLRAVKQYYGDRGYINAQVNPKTDLDPATKRVAVTYEITENDLVYVNRVEVQGNLRTKDVVIRRELRIHPGEAFDGKKIRRSLERLYNLGYFEEVTVDTQQTPVPNHDDLVVEVKEAKTGSFSFGGGFSSVDRVVGLIELEQRNFDLMGWPRFVGGGQDLRLRAEIGSVRRYFELSFTEPWFLGQPVSFGIDLFNRTRLRSSNLGLAFEEERRGGGIRLGKEFTETFRSDLGYQLFRTVISDVAEQASADLKAEEGSTNLSVLGNTLTWDTRDNRFDPTRGAMAFASGDLAGGVLQGDKEFYRLQSGLSAFVPHFDRFVGEGRIRVGVVNEYSDTPDVPIFERFFAGGSNTIRGFRERRVGPRDPLSNDPIGGEAMFIGSLEEVVTLYQNERGKPILKGSVFYDVGNVWRHIDEFGEEFESGTGVGVRVNTPIGPVRVDLGFPLTQLEDEERRPRVHFNISRSF